MPGMDKMKKLQGMMRGRDRAVVRPGETGMMPVKGKKNRLKEAAKKRMELRKKTKRNMMQRRMKQKSAGY
jgi:hypothetical protein